ncbi:hypothetical protein OEZ85_005193 [Tetradesmus obliquus]|uniref:Peptidase C1A papain C-terminal domain-containing protein n=1 Tax=Tetradesmus obliquus TaxID=3088 RepID=A0ABY8UJJ8_TETOB|nr:hypothetical protein OEZ85_005193 [Tetradesmus obliquus]
MAKSVLLLLAAVWLVWPATHLQRSVTAQGLETSDYLLGAGSAATAAEFETFEDSLALLNSGGRGRGGRGGVSNLGGFRGVKDFEQFQAAYYYIGGSPRAYESSNPSQTPVPDGAERGLNYVPQPNDQKLCSTCVGQAVATAAQISLAYALRRPVEQLPVSPLSIYYCAQGGRTCLTGWDIQPALLQLENNPQLLLPKKCFDAANARDTEAELSDWSSTCAAAAAGSAKPECKAITKEHPKYKCTYKSLSGFYQIQQAIRRSGAVITRIAMPDDFEVQFNHTKRFTSGLELPPYRFNTSAKVAYAHAAVITGYDNDNFTWTILNSYGRGDAADQTRLRGGVTADGMFKIYMGLAGVGTPEKSYAGMCVPLATHTLLLHGPCHH